jgi:membrane carboxypeptidase/penicillin-binding protein
MRTLFRVLFGFVAAVVILIVAAASWFFLYSEDLPDVSRLAQFAPATTTSVSDPCLAEASVAIPCESIGGNLRNALSAVEVRLPYQISRTMCRAPSKTLSRELNEIRTASRLERHFTQEELFTILANRASFGQGLIGVQSASQYFFHKNPGDLSVAEAALLAGLAQGHSYLSPVKHPDRAVKQRNEVIDAMAQAGTITASEAGAAKNAPLGIVAYAEKPSVH